MVKKSAPFLLPFRSVIFALIFLLGALAVGKDVGEISNWWSVAASAVNILTIAVLVFLAKKDGISYLRLVNYKKGRTKAGRIVAMCALILVVGMAGMYLAGFICYGKIPYAAPMMIAPIPLALAIINLPLLPITTALAEDGLYLGCGVNSFENKTLAVAAPAFFFALQHCFIPTLIEPRYIAYRFISFLPLTIILCRDYYKNRDPLPIMVGHALIDVATVMQILASSAVPGFYDKMCEM